MRSSCCTERFLLYVLVAVAVCGTAADGNWEWRCVWEDNFDSDTLDRSKWFVDTACLGPKDAKRQCFVESSNNVYVEDSKLKLKAIMQTTTECTAAELGTMCSTATPVTSGRVRTLISLGQSANGSTIVQKGAWKYGRFEVRAKLPKGDFLWPSMYLWPAKPVHGAWPASGEIDVFEARGQEPSKVCQGVHYGKPWPNNEAQTSTVTICHNETGAAVDGSDDFHTFGVEWTPSEIKWYIDSLDSVTFQVPLNQTFGHLCAGDPFRQPFGIVLALTVGGAYFPEDTYGKFTLESAKSWTSPIFEIDAVRVYKRFVLPVTSQTAPHEMGPVSVDL